MKLSSTYKVSLSRKGSSWTKEMLVCELSFHIFPKGFQVNCRQEKNKRYQSRKFSSTPLIDTCTAAVRFVYLGTWIKSGLQKICSAYCCTYRSFTNRDIMSWKRSRRRMIQISPINSGRSCAVNDILSRKQALCSPDYLQKAGINETFSETASCAARKKWNTTWNWFLWRTNELIHRSPPVSRIIYTPKQKSYQTTPGNEAGRLTEMESISTYLVIHENDKFNVSFNSSGNDSWEESRTIHGLEKSPA